MHLGSLFDCSPAVNFASRDAAGPNVQWGPRFIPDWQFFHVVSGEAVLQSGRSRCRISPGECVMLGPGSAHLLATTKETEYYSVHFAFRSDSPVPVHPAYLIREASSAQLAAEPERFRIAIPGAADLELPSRFSIVLAEPLFTRIVKEYAGAHAAYPFALRALIMELLTLVVRTALRSQAEEPAGRIGPALDAIRQQPGRKWTVRELAGLCGYHPGHFSVVFNREVGQNPKHYLIAERTRQAKQALLRGEAIEAIADALGYASIHYFSNNFKKETGLSPSEFRQRPHAANPADGDG
ncbi:helix-turn-helix domain-containing protein [Paenibacillus arenilitoris]|uniref:Helix-turn-helix transcriptional regulator n=1 Tax=Paenibacillus arenilitoris TaxID=2772299 RepID=A0A927H5T7_9BACL|nr:AraC family transcriptional regulator [Paenibacillus arenilitoris]MBD2868772.1 helix-turn-helix transcriptional regulator [Paenibacillus arenilitoris]